MRGLFYIWFSGLVFFILTIYGANIVTLIICLAFILLIEWGLERIKIKEQKSNIMLDNIRSIQAKTKNHTFIRSYFKFGIKIREYKNKKTNKKIIIK